MLNPFIYALPWVKTIQAFNALRKKVQIGTNIRRSLARTYVVRTFCILFRKMRAYFFYLKLQKEKPTISINRVLEDANKEERDKKFKRS